MTRTKYCCLVVLVACLARMPLYGAIVLDPGPAERQTPPPALAVPVPLEPNTNSATVAPTSSTVVTPSLRTNSAGAAERPLTLTLDLLDGSRIIGIPAAAKLSLNAGFGQMDLDLQKAVSIQWLEGKDKATVTFQNGDRLSGTLGLESFAVTSCFGPIKIPLSLVRRVGVSPGGKNSGNGLVLHYSFDRSPEDKIVPDQSGAGHEGTLMGVRWTPDGKWGGGCVISGNLDEIRVANTEQFILEEFTVALWIKRSNPNSTSSGGYHSVLFGYNTTGNALLGLQADGQIYVDGVDSNRQSVPARIADLQWHHVALVKKERRATVYLDGTTQGEVEYRVPANFRLGLSVGGVGRNIGYPFVGSMDEVRIYNRALSVEEIKSLAQDQP